MPTYRIYFLDNGAHISKPPVILECANSDEARQQAVQYIDGKDIELWCEDVLIAEFPAQKSARGQEKSREAGQRR